MSRIDWLSWLEVLLMSWSSISIWLAQYKSTFPGAIPLVTCCWRIWWSPGGNKDTAVPSGVNYKNITQLLIRIYCRDGITGRSSCPHISVARLYKKSQQLKRCWHYQQGQPVTISPGPPWRGEIGKLNQSSVSPTQQLFCCSFHKITRQVSTREFEWSSSISLSFGGEKLEQNKTCSDCLAPGRTVFCFISRSCLSSFYKKFVSFVPNFLLFLSLRTCQ